jgi:type VI secretion system secreted protein VgrG
VHVEGSSQQFASGTQEIVSDKEIILRCGKSSIRLTPDGLDVVVDKVRFVSKEIIAQGDEKIQFFTKKQFAVVAETADILASKQAVVAGEQGTLKLAADARLDGSVVKLNCDPEPPDPLKPPDYKPPELTQIELYDESGKPIARRRFVLRGGDGSERTGILDEQGKTEVDIDGPYEITFPDVDGARRG